jgi:hypothetical protein
MRFIVGLVSTVEIDLSNESSSGMPLAKARKA